MTIIAGCVEHGKNHYRIVNDLIDDPVREALGIYPADVSRPMTAGGEKWVD